MNYFSVCSGIEAATVAWRPLGWRALAFCEVERFPSALLAHHYPDVPNLGDITTLTEADLEPFIGRTDVLVGGTPCQSFSVAGARGGLADPRGNLALRFSQLARALRPEWLVWENVPGVLSSGGGRDFGSILGALADCGYGLAYRVLDAQYFGLAQRRKRVFVVGHLGDWRRAAAVLFDRASLSGNPPPSREAGEGVAHPVAAGLGASGRGFERAGETRGQDPVVAVPILEVGARTGGREGEMQRDGIGVGGDGDPMFTLQAGKQHGVCHSLRADGHDASEDGTGRGTPLVPVAFDCKQSGQGGECSPPLRAMGHDGSHANAGGQVAVAFQTRFARNGRGAPEQICPTLQGAGAGATSDMRPCVQQSMAVRRLTPTECERLQGFPDGYTGIPMHKRNPAAEHEDMVAYWLDTGQIEKPEDAWDYSPDGPRYKALGNSMAVPVMRWIGERIHGTHNSPLHPSSFDATIM